MSTDVDTDAFVAGLDYPMYIVTAASTEGGDTSLSGCLVGFATQRSLSPVRFMVCISKQNHLPRGPERQRARRSCPKCRPTGTRCPVRGNTGDEVDKFASCNWRQEPGGVPVLTDGPPPNDRGRSGPD